MTDQYPPPPPQPPEEPDEPAAPKRNWFTRHPVITGIGVVVIALIVIAAVAGGGDDETSTTDETTTTAATETTEPAETTEAPADETTEATEPEAPAGPTVNGEPDEVDDVTVTGTRVDQIGFMVADLSFTNDSSEASTYLVELLFLDGAGNEITNGAAIANEVQPGATGTAEANAAAEPPADGQFTVRLVSVDRLAA